MDAAVAYYRVSTARQGQSGLGLEAQQANVERFAIRNGLEVVEAFTEIETGTRKKQRPELERAIAETKAKGATLLIAKLDRLARNVAFVSNLMETGVEFVAVDMPQANRLTVHIIAAIAEHEAELISTRTKDALAAAKARGVVLGNPQNLNDDARAKGRAAQAAAAAAHPRPLRHYILTLREAGWSYRKIASQLNADGHRTRKGGYWHASQVRRVVVRG